MQKKTILTVLTLIVFVFSAAQATLAAWKVSDPSTQSISIARLSGKIVEKYEETTGVEPGQNIEKIVNVQNTGNADSVIRIRLEKMWGKSRTQQGDLIIDDSYSSDYILIEHNTEYWYYNEADNYYYYKGILLPGETTAQPLFEYFTVSKEANGSYNALTADIRVKLECIQAAGNAISIWDMSFEELGIVYGRMRAIPENSKVTFISKNKGFKFESDNSDLFLNFKNLLPGETRTQMISVTNKSSATEIFLRAEIEDQSKATPKTTALIEKLLKEYVTIVVTADDGTLVYNGPVWGNLESNNANPDSMRYDFSLGKFASEQTKDLSIQLQVDPKVDNEYQELWGDIRWVWSAQGKETPIDPPPQTGDDSEMYFYIVFVFLSGFILAYLLRSKAKDKTDNKHKI